MVSVSGHAGFILTDLRFVGLLSAFAITESDDARVVFLETVTEGLIVEAPSTVSSLMLRFDTLRLEALPRGASADLIARRAGEYEPD